MTTPTKPVVEQVDREAASDLLVSLGWHEDVVAAIRNGERDYWPTVQAFAAHRLQSEAPLRAEIARLRGALATAREGLDLTKECSIGEQVYKGRWSAVLIFGMGEESRDKMREFVDAIRAHQALGESHVEG